MYLTCSEVPRSAAWIRAVPPSVKGPRLPCLGATFGFARCSRSLQSSSIGARCLKALARSSSRPKSGWNKSARQISRNCMSSKERRPLPSKSRMLKSLAKLRDLYCISRHACTKVSKSTPSVGCLPAIPDVKATSTWPNLVRKKIAKWLSSSAASLSSSKRLISSSLPANASKTTSGSPAKPIVLQAARKSFLPTLPVPATSK
mmetsp:Transcript_63588/g.151695  ORF Transcript_63588/g.151695 Transcript_63588/m.151695 type:complete len:203 (-) Transcript_63588:193-801(-)